MGVSDDSPFGLSINSTLRIFQAISEMNASGTGTYWGRESGIVMFRDMISYLPQHSVLRPKVQTRRDNAGYPCVCRALALLLETVPTGEM
jgi:hypothetical protein